MQNQIHGKIIKDGMQNLAKDMWQRSPSSVWAQDGRWIIILCALLYLFMVAMLTGHFHASRIMVLQGMGVPAMEPLFGDSTCIARWCDAYGMGEDPRAADFKDPSGKIITMNYPVYFLGLHYVGLSAGTVPIAGWLLVILFLGSTLLLVGRCSLVEGLIWSVVLCSPVVVMAMERGNLDIIIYALLVLALLARDRPIASGFSILIGTALKFYPLAGFVSLLNRPKPQWFLFLVFVFSGVLSIAFGMATAGHTSSTLGLSSCCFGSKLIPLILIDRGIRIYPSLPGIFQAFAILASALSVWIGCLMRPSCTILMRCERSLAAFWIGVPIYLLVFLSGDQADYKMAMLLFALPAILAWRKSNGANRWITSLWLTLLLLYAYWLFFSDEGSLRNQLLRQIIAWALFLTTSIIVGILMPAVTNLLGKLRGTAS